MKPTNIDHNDNSFKSSHDISDLISNKELLQIIEDNLETKFRSTYLRLKGGSKVSKSDLLKLQDHIAHILQNNKIIKETL